MSQVNKIEIGFYGAAGEVTGSRHLVSAQADKSGAENATGTTTNCTKILLDCGMFQGHRLNALDKNKKIPFPVSQLDAVLLSHAHIDHCGGLPLLSANGLNSPVYCTPATQEIASIMLTDSARLQESDAKFFNKIHADKGVKIEPLYNEQDAHDVLDKFVSLEYKKELILNQNIKISFVNAGHVLGSAMVQIDFKTPKGNKRLLYTGDIGRREGILMQKPVLPESIDYLVIESTYGGRIHDSMCDLEKKFAEIIKRSVLEKGKILVPSFALERTQEIIFVLDKLRYLKSVPKIPVYVDSPMAVNITEIFNKYSDSFYFDESFRQYQKTDGDPFGFEYIHYVRTKEESQRLNDMPGPMIIISASGMLEGGRVLHHLRNNIDKENTTILIVGYQAEGTLGRRLQDGAGSVKIFGLEHEVIARVETIHYFSSHGDKNDLLSFISALNPLPEKIFLVHGENHERFALRDALKEKGINNVLCPDFGQKFELFS